ncbi:MAG: apolipoprotein N-acyltransferase [Thermodesulfovibrionales bacterium]|nr:apolipoprotein N-acyltransferase [Thermodesulfovibrionales bacterium]
MVKATARLIKGLLLPGLSGGLLILSFPRYEISLLAWISIVPLMIDLTFSKLSGRDAFKKGFFMGMVYFFGTLYWIHHSVHYYGGLGFVPSILVVLLLSAYLSLYTGLFSFLVFKIHTRTAYPLLLLAPSIWVSLEYIRTYFLTGFPWSSIGYTQYKTLHLIQIADITGIYGISFLVVAVNGAIVDLILMKKRLEDLPFYPIAPRLAGFVLLGAALIATFLYGNARLKENIDQKTAKISIVQGNIPQDKKWEPSFQAEVMRIYKDLTREIAIKESPELVVWPETAVPFIFSEPRFAQAANNITIVPKDTDEIFSADLTEFVKQINTYLLFGSIRKGYEKGQEYFTNGAILLGKDGKVTYTYDKIHLVPFGEYVPLRSVLFFIDKITVGIGDYRPGKDIKKAILPSGTFSTLICYEIIFPGLVRKAFKEGGDFIVNITNDAWFGRTSGPYQHFSMAVFRAIENRKPVIRAANTGISGFIDSKGRIIAQTPLFERLGITMDIGLSDKKTFYTRFGDLFVYFCLIVSILGLSRVLSI